MLDEPASSPWDRTAAGLWQKQALAVVALVLATLLSLWTLRAGWNLLVGGTGAARSREVVIWRDPVHELARDRAAGRGPARAAEADPAAGAAEDGTLP